MFETIFGSIWLLITGFIVWGAYSGTATTITVNGMQVSQEEFNEMIVPKLFLGIFVVIGLVFLIVGIVKIVRNMLTQKHGEECYAVIKNIYRSGKFINDCPELKADFDVYVESEFKVITVSEIIGFSPTKYRRGMFVKCKYYNGDINIINKVASSLLPMGITERLGVRDEEDEDDIITFNGSKYKKIE